MHEETGGVDLTFEGGTLTLSLETGVLLNGTRVTAEMLAALPAELSAQAGFLTDLLQSTVTSSEEQVVVITLPVGAAADGTAPARGVKKLGMLPALNYTLWTRSEHGGPTASVASFHF